MCRVWYYDSRVRVCVLMPFLDVYKGGNHLPLFAAAKDVSFTILTSRVMPAHAPLPSNVRVVTLQVKLGSYYFGCADYRFARAVLRTYPPQHPFWQDFDVLHLNQVLGPQFVRLQKTGVPVLYAIHHPVTADRAVAVEETQSCERLLWRLRYFFPVRWQKKLCRSLPHIMTVSRTVRDRLVDDFDIPSEKISIIPNGVDGMRFAPAADQPPEFDVIAVGSFLHPRKGFPYLLKAYEELERAGVRIADVGKRSPVQRAALQAVRGVTCFGTVSDQKITELIRCSAVLVSTSLYEGFGLSLIEALACGRPCVAFDAGAVREVLAPIDPSLVVPLRDVPSLVRRVREFLALSPADRMACGQRYRQSVLEHYPLSASAAALGKVYERIRGSALPTYSLSS